jgi:hypothetical protein
MTTTNSKPIIVKLETLEITSIRMIRIYTIISCIIAFALALFFGFYTYFWQLTTRTITTEAKTTIVCEGIIRLFATCMAMFICLTYPQRIVRHAWNKNNRDCCGPAKTCKQMDGVQIALIFICCALFATPAYSIYGIILFWISYDTSYSGDSSHIPILDLFQIMTASTQPNIFFLNILTTATLISFFFAFWGASIFSMSQYRPPPPLDTSTTTTTISAKPKSTTTSIIKKSTSTTMNMTDSSLEQQDKLDLMDYMEYEHHSSTTSTSIRNNNKNKKCCPTQLYLHDFLPKLSTPTTKSKYCNNNKNTTRATNLLIFLCLVIIYLTTYLTVGIMFKFQPSQVPFVGIITMLRVCVTVFLPSSKQSDNIVTNNTLPDSYHVVVSSPNIYNIHTVCSKDNHIMVGRTISVLVLFVLEIVLLWRITIISLNTKHELSLLPYQTSRSYQLGFIYFNNVTVFIWSFILFCAIITTGVSPIDFWTIRQVTVSKSNPPIIITSLNITFDPMYTVGVSNYILGFSTFYLLLAAWFFLLSFAYLPPDSFGIGGWFCPNPNSDIDQGETRRLLYYPTEQVLMMEVNSALIQQPLSITTPKSNDSELLLLSLKRAKSSSSSRMINEPPNNDQHQPQTPLQHQLFSHAFVLETQILLYHFMHVTYNLCEIKSTSSSSSSSSSSSLWEDKCKLIQDSRYRLLEHIHDSTTDTHAIISKSTDRVIISFRGTVSMINIKTDLDSAEIPHERAKTIQPLIFASHSLRARIRANQEPKVHAGFVKAWNSIRERVLNLIQDLRTEDPNLVLFITGHSLGGGLAIICAFDLAIELSLKRYEISVTTWGAPSVGNFSFARRFARVIPSSLRFVNAGDIITKLPVVTPLQEIFYHGWFPCGEEIVVNVSGNMIVQPSDIERHVIHGSKRWGSMESHLRLNYGLSLMTWSIRNHPDIEFDWWIIVTETLLKQHDVKLSHIHPTLKLELMNSLTKSGVVYKSLGNVMVRDFAVQTTGNEQEQQHRHKWIDEFSRIIYSEDDDQLLLLDQFDFVVNKIRGEIVHSQVHQHQQQLHNNTNLLDIISDVGDTENNNSNNNNNDEVIMLV